MNANDENRAPKGRICGTRALRCAYARGKSGCVAAAKPFPTGSAVLAEVK